MLLLSKHALAVRRARTREVPLPHSRTGSGIFFGQRRINLKTRFPKKTPDPFTPRCDCRSSDIANAGLRTSGSRYQAGVAALPSHGSDIIVVPTRQHAFLTRVKHDSLDSLHVQVAEETVVPA